MSIQVKKVIPVTTGELLSIMQRLPHNTPVWIGQCSACFAAILAFQGPMTTCQTCGSPAEVKPLTKKKKEEKSNGTG